MASSFRRVWSSVSGQLPVGHAVISPQPPNARPCGPIPVHAQAAAPQSYGPRHRLVGASPSWRRPLLRQPRYVLAALLATPAVAGGVAVLWLWWLGTRGLAVRGLADGLIIGGRITGMLGGYLLLVEVGLMARIPWLERRIGSDWLVRVHRWLGTYLITTLFAHAALLIGGLTLLDRVPIGVEASTVVLTYPDVLMATVALAVLIAVGSMSAKAARKRVRYETWHFVHLYVYLAVALAFAHQIVIGTDLQYRAARIAWSAAHVAVAATVLWFRVWRPMRLSLRHRLRVRRVVREADDIISIYITGRRLELLGAEAGQFFRWRFLARHVWVQAHPFSLSAAPTPRTMRITVKAIGDHTRALQYLRPGVRVIAEGPYGALTGVQRTRRRVLLIGAGIGITPMRALLEAMPGGPGDIALVFRGGSSEGVVFQRELEEIASRRQAIVHLILGPRVTCCSRHDALSAKRLRTLVPDVGRRDVYLCGPPGVLEATREALRDAGVPRRRIHIERFDY
jgi:predicted ferric reductase